MMKATSQIIVFIVLVCLMATFNASYLNNADNAKQYLNHDNKTQIFYF